MKLKIAIGIACVLAIAAIAISLWRYKSYNIDTVVVLANILALLVTVLLGVLAYNYFIQKKESDDISKAVTDAHLSIMKSFEAAKNYLGLFPLGVKVLEKIKDDNEQDVTQVCTLLNAGYDSMSTEERNNPVIKKSLTQLSVVLPHYTEDAAALQLLSKIGNG